jgi:hypothetical protein
MSRAISLLLLWALGDLFVIGVTFTFIYISSAPQSCSEGRQDCLAFLAKRQLPVFLGSRPERRHARGLDVQIAFGCINCT